MSKVDNNLESLVKKYRKGINSSYNLWAFGDKCESLTLSLRTSSNAYL